jgi:hypothetical protein
MHNPSRLLPSNGQVSGPSPTAPILSLANSASKHMQLALCFFFPSTLDNLMQDAKAIFDPLYVCSSLTHTHSLSVLPKGRVEVLFLHTLHMHNCPRTRKRKSASVTRTWGLLTTSPRIQSSVSFFYFLRFLGCKGEAVVARACVSFMQATHAQERPSLSLVLSFPLLCTRFLPVQVQVECRYGRAYVHGM